MQIIDISVPISSQMPTWPGNPATQISAFKRIAQGASSNVSQVMLGSHTGTHVDAPRHFLDGRAGVDELPLDVLIGPCRVLELPDATGITADDLRAAAAGSPPGARLLLKTRNSALWDGRPFSSDFAHLTPDGAEWLVAAGVRLVGIDYLSIERFKAQGAPVHHILLGADVVIIEGLNLANVTAGPYEMICLPLKLAGADGAPARVVVSRS
jgi:arylformamidase